MPYKQFIEGENDDERNGRVAGELDVVESDVHEPITRYRHTLRRSSIALYEVDRLYGCVAGSVVDEVDRPEDVQVDNSDDGGDDNTNNSSSLWCTHSQGLQWHPDRHKPISADHKALEVQSLLPENGKIVRTDRRCP